MTDRDMTWAATQFANTDILSEQAVRDFDASPAGARFKQITGDTMLDTVDPGDENWVPISAPTPNPLGEYEDAEAMFQHLSDTLTENGVNDTLAFFIATAAFDFAEKHANVFAAYLAGTVTNETIQDAFAANA